MPLSMAAFVVLPMRGRFAPVQSNLQTPMKK
jgi:hypothetical protein